MTHTKLPWKISTDSVAEAYHIVAPWSGDVKAGEEATFGDYRGAHICKLEFVSERAVPTPEKALANAELIVRAVNNHGPLEVVAKAAQELMDLDWSSEEFKNDPEAWEWANGWAMLKLFNALKALASAKGED